jgi:ankyrin repeat protein
MLIDRYSDGFENVKILIDNGDFEGVGAAINNSGRTFGLDRLLKYACNKGKEKFYPVAAHVINAILKEGFSIEEENACLDEYLMNAIYNSDVDELKNYVKKNGSTNAKALSLLYISADDSFQGAEVGNDLTGDDRQIVLGVSFRIALEILDFKRMLNIFPLGVDAGLQGRALILAAWEGHVGFVKALLAYKVDGKVVIDINARNSKGDTVLTRAAWKGHVDVVKALLVEGANINAQNSKGDTALTLAARKGHVGCVEALLDYKVDGKVVIDMDLEINHSDYTAINQGALALHVAARKGHVDVVKALLAKVADINTWDSDGDPALHVAAREGHVGCVEALLAKGADINAWDSVGDSVLHAAVRGGHVRCVKALLAKGANINVQNFGGNTALTLAAWGGHVGCIEALLAKGADINARGSDDGSTALHTAVQYSWVDVVKMLMRHGADPAIKDDGGETALSVASEDMKDIIREEWKRAKLYSIAKPVLYSAVTIGCTGGGYALLLYGAPMVLSVVSATYAMLGAAAAFGALVSFLLGEAYPEGIKDVACKAYTKLGMTRYDLAISSETDSVGLAA